MRQSLPTGFAFVLLASATGFKAGVEEATTWNFKETFDLMECISWDLSLTYTQMKFSSDLGGKPFQTTRGQNAINASCEALLAAYECHTSTPLCLNGPL